jgi:signal transduction histidine kinase
MLSSEVHIHALDHSRPVDPDLGVRGSAPDVETSPFTNPPFLWLGRALQKLARATAISIRSLRLQFRAADWRPILRRGGFVALLVGAACAVALPADKVLEHGLLLPFMAVIIIVSILLGLGPALFATVLSLAGGAWAMYDTDPRPAAHVYVVSLSMLALAGTLSAWLGESQRRARRDLAQEKAALEGRVARRTARLETAITLLKREMENNQRAQAELRNVANHARCILWYAELEGGRDWGHSGSSEAGNGHGNAHGNAQGNAHGNAHPNAARCFAWHVRVQDENAAQAVLPLDVPHNSNYFAAWMHSRHSADSIEMGRTVMDAVLKGVSSYQQEYRCTDKYGEVRYLSEHVHIEPMSPGRWRLVGVTTDVTEYRRAVEAMHQSQERFVRFMKHLPGIAFIKDRDGRYVFMNDTCGRVIGCGDKWENRKDAELLEPDAARELRADDALVLRRGQVLQTVDRIPGPGGPLYYMVSKFVIPQSGGELLGGIGIDITERKRAEAEVEAQQRRLKNLALEVSQIEERERRRIATALHDQIGAALAIAQMQLELSRQEDESSRRDRAVGRAIESIEEAIGHTRSLTCELSPPVLYESGLEAAVRWLAEEMGRRYGLPVAVEEDRRRHDIGKEMKIVLFQAVRELLTNVVKHAKAKTARIRIAGDEHWLRIGVEDDGVGLGTPSPSSRPNGFGLFNVRERLLGMGGRLEVESEKDRGTRVTIVAPLKL